MILYLRVLLSRLRRTGTLTLLRLTSLALAALLAAAVPAFVTTAMERVLSQELKSQPLTITVGWDAPDENDHTAAAEQLDAYLRSGWLQPGGFSSVSVARLTATVQRTVQLIKPGGSLDAARHYYKLAQLPGGLTLSSGRLPADGQPEVAISDNLATKAGYKPGDQLRFPLTADARVAALTVQVVGR